MKNNNTETEVKDIRDIEHARDIKTGTILRKVTHCGSKVWVDTLGNVHGSTTDDGLELEFAHTDEPLFMAYMDKKALLQTRKFETDRYEIIEVNNFREEVGSENDEYFIVPNDKRRQFSIGTVDKGTIIKKLTNNKCLPNEAVYVDTLYNTYTGDIVDELIPVSKVDHDVESLFKLDSRDKGVLNLSYLLKKN